MRTPIEERFWKYVNKTETCWLWTRALSQGYGNLFRGISPDCGSYRAHRVSWMIHKGKIPKGKYVLHKCDVRHCVNPRHLFIGTAKDNTRDMLKKGREARGEYLPQHILTEAQVIEIKKKYKWFVYTQKMLAKEYGVHVMTINCIIKGRNWKHLIDQNKSLCISSH